MGSNPARTAGAWGHLHWRRKQWQRRKRRQQKERRAKRVSRSIKGLKRMKRIKRKRDEKKVMEQRRNRTVIGNRRREAERDSIKKKGLR